MRALSAFKQQLLTGMAGIAIVSLSGTAQGQQVDAAPPPLAAEEIIVTGFRDSLAAALSLKRNETTAVDAILAEDIGKFPDLNLSEAVQRIPGVALARDAGEGRQVSVRGLGPQFTRVRINGMEALTTTGGTDAAGGTNRGRNFDFNVFAADLFNAITVRKTPSAETEEGSLGATVDLRTALPFDYKGFKFAASGQGSYNDLAGKISPRGAAMIANNWGDFGVLVSGAYTKRKLIEEGASTVRWATGNAFAPGFQSAPAGMNLADINAAYHPRIPRLDKYSDDQERIGITGAVQWRPADTTLLTANLLYADFKGTREEQFLEVPSFSTGSACTAANLANSCGIADTNVNSATIDSNNTLIKGNFDDVDLRVEDRFDRLRTKFTQFTLDGEHEFSDNFKVHAIGGHSTSKHRNPIQTTLTFDQFNVDGYAYDYSQGRVPLLTYGNANLTNPGSWVLTQIRERPQTADNKFDTAQGDLEYRWSDELKLSGGFNWKKYSFVTTELRRTNGTTTNQEPVIPAAIAAIPLANYSKTLTLKGSGLGLPAGSVLTWLVPDLNAASSALSLYDQSAFNGAFRLGPEPALGNNNSVRETDTGGFVQAAFDTFLFGMRLRGNVGVRRVHTEQSASGYTFVSGLPVGITVDRTYNDTLPSLNLAAEPIDNFLVRFAVAKVMTRPNLGNLTPGATVSVSGTQRTVTAGNPLLKPFRANSYDLAFEWYFQPQALLSVALFRKDVQSFIQTLTSSGTFAGNPFGIPDSVAIAACGTTSGCSPSSTWTFTTPVNSTGGTLNGLELSYQQPFKFLPGLLANTGLLANLTYVKSRVPYLNAAGAVVATEDLTGLSRRTYNATLYYEDEKISARVSTVFRSKYLTRVPGQEAGTSYDGTNSTINVDLSLQYSFTDQIKVTFEAINLTDQFQDQFNDSTNRLSFYHHTGREFLVGVRYTY